MQAKPSFKYHFSVGQPNEDIVELRGYCSGGVSFPFIIYGAEVKEK
jgi:hypothetical protein